MKELIYFYLIVGCYIAHRKTADLDATSSDFLKTYLKTILIYPKELFSTWSKTRRKVPKKTEKQGE